MPPGKTSLFPACQPSYGRASATGRGGKQIRFYFCGTPCYIRLWHSLIRGDAEYGVLLPGISQDHFNRREIHRVDLYEFTASARQLPENAIANKHYRILADIFPKMLDAFLENTSTRTGQEV